MSEKDDVIEGPGFTIIDRRIGAKKSEDVSPHDADKKGSSEQDRSTSKQKARKHETKGKERPEEKTSHEIPLPEVDFPAFIMSLCTSVLIHLGDIPDPTTNQECIDLPLAKQTIDIISK